MLIIQNVKGGGTNLINSGINHAGGHSNNSNTNVDLYKLVGNEDYPIGSIINFNSLTMPPGWVLCDGHNGTPNLTNKFVKCGKNFNDQRRTGGYKDITVPAHKHTVTMGTAWKHTHSYKAKTYTISAAGRHHHQQKHSPKHTRGVCTACQPVTCGSHTVNKNVTTKASGARGNHTHTFDFANTRTGNGGGHTHTSKTVTTGTSGVGKNIPQNVALYFIMKIK